MGSFTGENWECRKSSCFVPIVTFILSFSLAFLSYRKPLQIFFLSTVDIKNYQATILFELNLE